MNRKRKALNLKPMTIYFDNNATTLLDPVVAERMHDLAIQGVANPASQHSMGRLALEILEDAKSAILESVCGNDTSPYQVILTSGGTEANNLALLGRQRKHSGAVIVGGSDHPSVLQAAMSLGPEQFRVLPVDTLGRCDVNRLRGWLAGTAHDAPSSVSLVSVMLGNNETGIVQDLCAVSEVCQSYGVPLHSDVVQAVGKIDVDLGQLGLSAATLTGHKIHGPVGAGALIARQDFDFSPMIIGGGQQLGLRPGTEPVILAAGLQTALLQISRALDAGDFQHISRLRDQFEDALVESCGAIPIARDVPRLPHTANVSFPGVDRQALQMALDLNGIACSTGSACASGSARPSGSLVAMGLPDELVQSSLRFSFSRFTTPAEIDEGGRIVSETVLKCRSLNFTQ